MAEPPKNLTGLIIQDTVECLNESEEHKVGNLFTTECHLESDADVDPELLIKFAFRAPVKLSGILLRGMDAETCPKEVQIFMNKPDLDFQSAEEEKPAQTLELTPKECNTGGEGGPNTAFMVELDKLTFRQVHQLEILVKQNNGEGDITKISTMEFFGTTVENSVIGDWKPIKG